MRVGGATARPDVALGPPSWRWLKAALASIVRLDAPGVLERVATPVLLLGTDRDRLVSASAIRRAAARLPNARLVMLDGAHELLREADAVRTAAFAAIDAFLDEPGAGAMIRADVAIVGAGMAGASLAAEMARGARSC